MVYIKEAHPENSDEAALIHNVKAGIHVEEASTDTERAIVARTMCSTLQTQMPCVVDSVDNRVNDIYAAWPARVYLVGADGKVLYRSGPGPEGFKPGEARDALEKLLGVATQVSSAAAR
jgi:hypothetical protein